MWRVIEEFPNYMINEHGVIYKVKGKRKNLIMKPKVDKDGYYYIGLRNEKGRFFRRIHQLVAKAFIKNNNKNFNIVNHMDGNKQNNHFTNLEWCDMSYNTKYSFDKLGRKGTHTTDIKCKLYKSEKFVGDFNNIKEAVIFAKKKYNAPYSSLYKNRKWGDVKISIDC